MNPDSCKAMIVLIDDSGIKDIDLGLFGKKDIYFGRAIEHNDIIINSPNTADVQGLFMLRDNGIYIVSTEYQYGLYIARNQFFEQLRPNTPIRCHSDTIIDLGYKTPNMTVSSAIFICNNSTTDEIWRSKTLHDGYNYIGRDVNCDIFLDDNSISRMHAAIVNSPGQSLFIIDRRIGCVIINETPIFGQYLLHEKDIITIGKTRLIYINGHVFYKTTNTGFQLTTSNLSKVIGHGMKQKVILNNANCVIDSNEFVAIIGCSGAGKTTLMNAMSGFDPCINGNVFINGIDLHENFDALKNVIGYVPQQDIIYENLKLKRMLLYTAKMRMPKYSSKRDIKERISAVLNMVGLTEHANTYIKKLSGGQKKRASIAVELLADPGLFFLDEPTSGLDPFIEVSLMYTLKQLSKEQHKTIIMVTHSTNNLDICDKVIVMGEGGRLCFCNHSSKFKETFNCNSIIDIYEQVQQNSSFWEERERENNIQVKCIKNNEKKIKYKKGSFLKQLFVLVFRYAELIKNDSQLLSMMILQPIIVALLLNVVAEKGVFSIYEPTKSVLFALTCAGIWIGLFDSIQEITKERVILKREYMSQLRILTYMLSKIIVLGIASIAQSFILISIFTKLVGRPEKGLLINQSYFEMLIICSFTIFTAVVLGLALSVIAKRGDRAMALAPFILMFQLLFSGILFPLKNSSKWLSYFTISRWSMEAYGSLADLNNLPLKLSAIPGVVHKVESLFERTKNHYIYSFGALCIGILVVFSVSCCILSRIKNEQR